MAVGGDVEDLFTTLPDSIVRSEFSDVTALDILLLSSEVHRTMEFVAFTDLATYGQPGDPSTTGLVISDADDLEHVENITLDLGGEVDLGYISIGNGLGGPLNPSDIDQAAIRF